MLGGEVAALAVIEGVTRLIPGAVGNPASTEHESFRHGELEEPQYTRPAAFRGWEVPEVLLSGDHRKIAEWRAEQRRVRTAKRRPDLIADEEPATTSDVRQLRSACRYTPSRIPSQTRSEDPVNTIEEIEAAQLRDDLPEFSPGDNVRVHVRVIEGGRERIQVFEGVVIARSGGSGARATFTVRKLSFGVGVERIFPVHSPIIQEIEVTRLGDVRRAKLYYLRDRVGKATRIKEKREQ